MNNIKSFNQETRKNLFNDLEFLKQIQYIGGAWQSYDEKNYNDGIIKVCSNDSCENFNYVYADNNKEITQKDLEYVNSLKIPTWCKYAWIDKKHKTNLLAIWHDKRKKKQYIYSKEHKDKASKEKFDNLKLFISLLPKFKNLIDKYENPKDLSLNSILALMAHIILLTGIRAGKEFHRQRSNSYGLTSLRRKHIELMENKKKNKKFIRLSFIGKSKQHHVHDIYDEKIVEFITNLYNEGTKKRLDPDDKIFMCFSKDNYLMGINEHHLNNFIHDNLNPKIVIKDIRTFVANYTLILNIKKILTKDSYTRPQMKKLLTEAVKQTADFIQHTPTICKTSYLNPNILLVFMNDYQYFYKNRNEDSLVLLNSLI